MRKSWPFALAVIIVGGLAGVAIAGRPVPNDPFVLDPSLTIADSTSTSTVASTTSTVESMITTTIAATTSVRAPTSIAPTSAPTTTTAATTTTSGALQRDQVRLVLANGDGRFRLASVTADRIRSLGYVIDLGDSLSPVDATVI
jgi:hypothetical protein